MSVSTFRFDLLSASVFTTPSHLQHLLHSVLLPLAAEGNSADESSSHIQAHRDQCLELRMGSKGMKVMTKRMQET